MKKIYVLGIDIQNDFIDLPKNEIEKINGHSPTMAVNGSWENTQTLARFINEEKDLINNIVLTFDTHNRYHVAHPMFWVDQDGNNPDSFTLITNDDVVNGKWIPVNKNHPRYGRFENNISLHEKMCAYTKELEDKGNLTLCIWPEHCISGGQGHNLPFILQDAISNWENEKLISPSKYQKGLYPYSESYGAVHAEVIDNKNPDQWINHDILSEVGETDQYDYIVVAGQALSHCVSATIKQIVENLPKEVSESFLNKLILMEDGTSSVAGFESNGEEFVREFQEKGMRVMTSDQIKELIHE